MYNPIRTVIEYLGEDDPLLLSHHPVCDYYSHHTIEVYDQRLCMGCFVVYPIAFLSLAALLVARFTHPELPLYGIPTTTIVGIAFALATPLLVGKLLPVPLSSRQRLVGKAFLAVGLAVLVFSILFRPAERLLISILFVTFLVSYTAYKAATLRDDCEGCPEADEFPNCSGMTFDETYQYAKDNDSYGRL